MKTNPTAASMVSSNGYVQKQMQLKNLGSDTSERKLFLCAGLQLAVNLD